MKRFITAFGICLLLPVFAAATALEQDVRIWQSTGTSAWGTAGNWIASDVPDTCSGPGEIAQIDKSQSATKFPVEMASCRDIYDLDLADGTAMSKVRLDLKSQNLYVSNRITVWDQISGATNGSYVEITDSTGTGTITTGSFSVEGGASYGVTIKVSGGATIVTASVTCTSC